MKRLINEHIQVWLLGLVIGSLIGIAAFSLVVHLIVTPECLSLFK